MPKSFVNFCLFRILTVVSALKNKDKFFREKMATMYGKLFEKFLQALASKGIILEGNYG